MKCILIGLLFLLKYVLGEVYLEQDIGCEQRLDPMLVYLQSKTTGIAKVIRTINSTDEIIL